VHPRAPEGMEEHVRRSVREALGLEVESVTPIREGLAVRSFFRVRAQGVPGSVVVRVDAPEDPAGRPAGVPPEPALEPLRTFLAERGVPVPLHFGSRDGTDLLEDLGSRSLRDVARDAAEAERAALYDEACDLVVRFQRAGLESADAAGMPAFGRRLDRKLFHYKADLFAEWSLPTALGRPPRAAERELVHQAFEAVAEAAEAAPQRLAHRDLQSSNLYVRPGRRPGHRLAVIDFQGALLAPPEYDLVCLLRDSYVALSDTEVARLLGRTRPRLPDRPDAATFQRRFDLLTLSRKGKDHARFLFAAGARGDRRFLAYLADTTRYLKAAAARTAGLDPRLARLAELVAQLPEAPCAG